MYICKLVLDKYKPDEITIGMPFTLAHPAIILPLGFLPKKWISMTAIVVGSVMPDFEAFVRTRSEKELTHSWLGFLWFGLPAGILLTFLFHNAIRDPLIFHLPAFLRQRFLRFTTFNWNRRFISDWPAVIFSLAIGGASHFFWDGFSHFDGWFINSFPKLKGEVYVLETRLEIPFLIQYINTLLGVLIILIFVLTLPREKTNPTKGNLPGFWTSVILVSIPIGALRLIYIPGTSMDDLIIGCISILSLALTIVAFFFEKPRVRSLRVQSKNRKTET